jgi:hypothetical protein
VACGARTDLQVLAGGSGPQGSGGSDVGATGPGGSAPGGGGTGGIGPGGSGGCSELVIVGPIASLAGGSGFHQRQPALTPSSTAGDRVSVVSEWFVVEGPQGIPSELRHTAFQPWDAWPVDGMLAPTYLADLDAGVSFAAAPSPGDRLALLMSDGSDPQPPAGVLFSPEFEPGQGTVPVKYSVEPNADAARFISLSNEAPQHLLGFERPTLPRTAWLASATTRPNGVSISAPVPFGCADTEMSADAVPFADGWLLVGSSAMSGVGGVCPDPGPIGLIDALLVARVVFGGFIEWIFAYPVPQVIRVRATPHPLGVLAVWADTAGINASAFDEVGTLIENFAVSSPPDNPSGESIGAGLLGDQLVVAFVDQRIDNPNDIVVRVFENGAVANEARVQPLALQPDPISVLGSPDGQTVLVSWSETEDGAARVRVARFECR